MTGEMELAMKVICRWPTSLNSFPRLCSSALRQCCVPLYQLSGTLMMWTVCRQTSSLATLLCHASAVHLSCSETVLCADSPTPGGFKFVENDLQTAVLSKQTKQACLETCIFILMQASWCWCRVGCVCPQCLPEDTKGRNNMTQPSITTTEVVNICSSCFRVCLCHGDIPKP